METNSEGDTTTYSVVAVYGVLHHDVFILANRLICTLVMLLLFVFRNNLRFIALVTVDTVVATSMMMMMMAMNFTAAYTTIKYKRMAKMQVSYYNTFQFSIIFSLSCCVVCGRNKFESLHGL